MKINNFDELIRELKENVNIYAKKYQLDMNEINSTLQIEEAMKSDLISILDSDFKNVSNCFKSKIVNFFNENFKILGTDLSGYIVFRDAILAHVEIKYQYYDLKMPFGYKDKDKYDKKMNTWLKKYNNKKIKFFVQPILSPYERVKFVTMKLIKNVDMDYINCLYNIKRDREQFKRELIVEIGKIVLCDCNNYFNQLKSLTRVTNTNKQMYEYVLETYEETLSDKAKKAFVIKP